MDDTTSALPPVPRADRTAFSSAASAIPISAEPCEWALFGLLIAGLAWVPLWHASTDPFAWGVNAILFPGLVAVYEISLLARGRPHPVGLRALALPVGLWAAVVVWILLQDSTWVGALVGAPIWRTASHELAKPLAASVSIDRDLTTLALLRLLTASSAFWLALQLCRRPDRAALLVGAVAAIACVYALYGLAEMRASHASFVASTFINRNAFATYAGIGLVAFWGLILQAYRRGVIDGAGALRTRVASWIDTTGRAGAPLIAGAAVALAALLLTGSRGGAVATATGLFTTGALALGAGRGRPGVPAALVVACALLVGVALLAFGNALVASLADRGVSDANRLAVYRLTLRSILDRPLLGYGYGTFRDVFPLFRDRSLPVQGIWGQAHDTYLELFQGLGLLFGTLFLIAVATLVRRSVSGALARRENGLAPLVAAGAAALVGVHALVDFGLQIQAVALTFAALLGAGVAQSASSRVALEDSST
ncbi:MAG TPA: O-antigen ligase family protein [Alphaproteobacteria bacterium]|nr:O-antigen ligase family protein [Alphaproteobacteria bacterium]